MCPGRARVLFLCTGRARVLVFVISAQVVLVCVCVCAYVSLSLSLYLYLSIYLSIYLTHTHTHTHTVCLHFLSLTLSHSLHFLSVCPGRDRVFSLCTGRARVVVLAPHPSLSLSPSLPLSPWECVVYSLVVSAVSLLGGRVVCSLVVRARVLVLLCALVCACVFVRFNLPPTLVCSW